MPSAENWRKKYMDALTEVDLASTQLSELEDLLRLTVRRLSVAASGSDQTLDEQLSKLRNRIKKTFNKPAIESILDQITESLKRIETETKSGKLDRLPSSELLAKVLKGVHFPDEQKDQAYLLSNTLTKKNADQDVGRGVDETIALINQCLTAPTQPAERSRQSSHDEPSSYDAEPTKNGQAGSIPAIPVITADTTQDIADILITFIDRLALPARLGTQVTELKERLSLGKSVADTNGQRNWTSLFIEVANLVGDMRAGLENERQELEQFLLQLTGQLQSIDQSLTSTERHQQASFTSGQELGEAVTSDLSGLQKSAAQAHDISELRSVVDERLEHIHTRLKDFKSAEDRRQKTMSDEMLSLRQRLNQMESETKELNTKLDSERINARTDPLTKIANRFAYDQQIDAAFKHFKKGSQELAIVLCDIDRFKQLNDTLGHQVGDKALQSIAAVLQRCAKEKVFVARYGGEEFVALISAESGADILSNASLLAENFRAEVERAEFKCQGKIVPITISCGVADFRPASSIADVFRRADEALYRAKEAGRNCVICDEPS